MARFTGDGGVAAPEPVLLGLLVAFERTAPARRRRACARRLGQRSGAIVAVDAEVVRHHPRPPYQETQDAEGRRPPRRVAHDRSRAASAADASRGSSYWRPVIPVAALHRRAPFSPRRVRRRRAPRHVTAQGKLHAVRGTVQTPRTLRKGGGGREPVGRGKNYEVQRDFSQAPGLRAREKMRPATPFDGGGVLPSRRQGDELGQAR